MLDTYCVVRCRDAGVWAGVVRQVNGRAVLLGEANRVWNWRGGVNTLSEASLRGLGTARIAETVARVLLLDACEIIPCTPEAEANLRQSRWDQAYVPAKAVARA